MSLFQVVPHKSLKMHCENTQGKLSLVFINKQISAIYYQLKLDL